jgi:pimeloyl-ACP methyl ester carboxylesterase
LNDVLLLHGQPGHGRDWDRVAAALGSRWRPIAIDRPGWDGRSTAADVAGNALAAVRSLDEAGVSRATIAGHSWGAAVAAWVASAYPKRVDALVLAAPSANRASLVWLDQLLGAPGVGYGLGAAALGGPGYALALAPVRRAVARSLALDERYLASIGALLRTPAAWRSFSFEQRALVRDLPELERRVAGISAPATILAGDRDRIVPLSSARLLAKQIPGAKLLVLPGAGHLLAARHPERIAEAIVSAGAPRGRAVSGVSLD